MPQISINSILFTALLLLPLALTGCDSKNFFITATNKAPDNKIIASARINIGQETAAITAQILKFLEKANRKQVFADGTLLTFGGDKSSSSKVNTESEKLEITKTWHVDKSYRINIKNGKQSLYSVENEDVKAQPVILEYTVTSPEAQEHFLVVVAEAIAEELSTYYQQK